MTAELGEGDSRRRSPRHHCRVLASEHRMVECASAWSSSTAASWLCAAALSTPEAWRKMPRAMNSLSLRNAGVVEETTQGVGGRVTVESRQYRLRRGDDDYELGAQQVGCQRDRRLRVCLR